MQHVNVDAIVPSTRDLLQVLGTRRRSLALVALVAGERPEEEAARLAELNVSAFAGAEPGPAMALAARASKTVPSLCLAPATDREHLLAARQFGADGVCIDATMPLDAWDKLAKVARTMRMLPLALATDAAGLDAAVKAGARAILLRAGAADPILEIAGKAPRAVTLVAHVEGADAAALRALAGRVDAAVVPPVVHASPGFAELVAEVDP
jgi:indole-3-glycerol phosphate synthase